MKEYLPFDHLDSRFKRDIKASLVMSFRIGLGGKIKVYCRKDTEDNNVLCYDIHSNGIKINTLMSSFLKDKYEFMIDFIYRSYKEVGRIGNHGYVFCYITNGPRLEFYIDGINGLKNKRGIWNINVSTSDNLNDFFMNHFDIKKGIILCKVREFNEYDNGSISLLVDLVTNVNYDIYRYLVDDVYATGNKVSSIYSHEHIEVNKNIKAAIDSVSYSEFFKNPDDKKIHKKIEVLMNHEVSEKSMEIVMNKYREHYSALDRRIHILGMYDAITDILDKYTDLVLNGEIEDDRASFEEMVLQVETYYHDLYSSKKED